MSAISEAQYYQRLEEQSGTSRDDQVCARRYSMRHCDSIARHAVRYFDSGVGCAEEQSQYGIRAIDLFDSIELNDLKYDIPVLINVLKRYWQDQKKYGPISLQPEEKAYVIFRAIAQWFSSPLSGKGNNTLYHVLTFLECKYGREFYIPPSWFEGIKFQECKERASKKLSGSGISALTVEIDRQVDLIVRIKDKIARIESQPAKNFKSALKDYTFLQSELQREKNKLEVLRRRLRRNS